MKVSKNELRTKFFVRSLILLMLSALLGLGGLSGCKGLSGSEGAQGPKGDQGAVGPAGDNGSMMYSGQGAPTSDIGNEGDYYLNTNTGELFGPKDSDGWGKNPIIVLMGQDGEDGSQIYAGQGAPSASMGNIGDFYLNKDNGDFYGPKTENGWGQPTNLKGADGQDGQNGADGSQIYAGTGAPAATMGQIGDFYLDESNGDFYGPKTENGWGQPTNLKGADGQDGQDGADGSVIHAGTGAPAASLGKVGDFYLDESNGDFYGPKTENGWGQPTNLKGADGQDGADGSVIHAGTGVPAASLGKVGDFYLDKSNGDFYGPKTASGWGQPTNLKGADGQNGQDGADGSQIYAGTGVPAASMGQVGDYYLDKSSYELYGPKTSNGWGSPINLKGADGNANVIRYIFPGYDFSDTSRYPLDIVSISSLTKSEFQNSGWLFYLKKNLSNGNTFYYVVPGLARVERFRVEYYYDDNSGESRFYIETETGDPGQYYDNIIVVRMASSSTVDNSKIRPGGVIPGDLDTTDYRAVANYYGFGPN